MKHPMKLFGSPFERIKSGKKIIEIRLFDEKRQRIKVGDEIEFSKLPELDEKISVEVIKLLKYSTFLELVNDFGMEYYGYPKDYSVEKFLDEVYEVYSKEPYFVITIKFISNFQVDKIWETLVFQEN
jgi:ASC-1-like (ASCH) protein